MKIIDHIISRTPLLPFSEMSSASFFSNIIEDKGFQEAIYLASPVLYEELIKYKEGLIKDEKELNKFKVSIYKYASRASSRCTPFGLFAGLNTCKWGDNNTIHFDDDLQNIIIRKTKLDMNIVCKIIQELNTHQCIKPHLKYYTNTSIYKTGDFYRYIEYFYHNSKRVHKLSKIDYSQYLEVLFETSLNGTHLDTLVKLLVKMQINPEEATEVIEELIDARLLVTQLEPSVTGEEFFETVINDLLIILKKSPTDELRGIISRLQEVKILVSKLDTNKINDISCYRVIFDELKAILPNISEINIVQTDLFKTPIKATIDKGLQQNIINTLKFLNRITPIYRNQNLEEFKKRFLDRYQEEEVPLLNVMDNETGIGYPNKDNEGINNLVDDILINRNSKNSIINWDHFQSILFQILNRSLKEGKYSIELNDSDFKGVDFSNKNLPHSLAVRFKLLNAKTNKICFEGAGGSSAVNILGRFAHGNTSVSEIIELIVKHEDNQFKEKILAEIVHLPQDRTGNILSRPLIRAYEIPYLAKSSVDSEHQLNVNDLYISIKNNFIVLRNKRLNKEIIPRLGNAHNFNFNSLPLYHFLCDLQLQYFEKPSLNFNWGALASQYSFLPRAEYKNVVLSPAKWQLKKEDFECLLKTEKQEKILQAFCVFKEKYKLPSLFLLIEGDNELLIDTTQEISVLAFIDALKNKQNITIEEFLFDMETPLVKDTNERGFTNECIALILNDESRRLVSPIQPKQKKMAKRKFIIGDEWLYYKIYCGIKTADYILKEKLSPIITSLFKKEIIDKWFFIRYADPEAHIRFRLHIKHPKNYIEVLDIVRKELEKLINEAIIFKVQIDIYARELERYGDNTIEYVESLFYFDSTCCIKALSHFNTDQDEKARWQYAIRAVDQLLTDFKLNAQEKYVFTNNLSQSFFKEHGGKKELKLQLDLKFRKLRKDIDAVLSMKFSENPLLSLLNERSNLNEKIIADLSELRQSQSIDIKINDLLANYLHMMNNRIFIAKQRTNEFVVYDMLSRYYKSALAKEKHVKNSEMIPKMI